ncbi:MAG: hypothetical protein IIZ06_00160 [Kiritimatiellae bacterium]|nr:hypothetical protein [Kiritimatiellia bacterium]
MPTPASEILAKAIMPTGLSSAELRDTVAPEIRRRSFFSARTAEAEYLVKARQVCADVAAGKIGQAKARELLAQFLAQVGYDGVAGAPGPITDVGSEERLNLIIDTQRDMAHSAALLEAQTPDLVARYPAWRLVRVGKRRDPRDWQARWAAAFAECGGKGCAPSGEMVARKDSPVWDKIGAGAGGYRDTLGNPFPPFAFNSGIDWEDVDVDTAEGMGIDCDDISPKGVSLAPDKADIDRVKKRLGPEALDALKKQLAGMGLW